VAAFFAVALFALFPSEVRHCLPEVLQRCVVHAVPIVRSPPRAIYGTTVLDLTQGNDRAVAGLDLLLGAADLVLNGLVAVGAGADSDIG